MEISRLHSPCFFSQSMQSIPIFPLYFDHPSLNTSRQALTQLETIKWLPFTEFDPPDPLCFRTVNNKSCEKKEKASFHPLLNTIKALFARIQNGLILLISTPLLPIASANPLDDSSQLEDEKRDLRTLETLSCIMRGRLEKIEPTCASMNFSLPLGGKIQAPIQRIWKKTDGLKGCQRLTSYHSIDSLITSINQTTQLSFALQKLQCLQIKEKGDYAYFFTSYVYPITKRLQCSNDSLPTKSAKTIAACDAECEGILMESSPIANKNTWPLASYVYRFISFICGFFFVLVLAQCAQRWRSKNAHPRCATKMKRQAC